MSQFHNLSLIIPETRRESPWSLSEIVTTRVPNHKRRASFLLFTFSFLPSLLRSTFLTARQTCSTVCESPNHSLACNAESHPLHRASCAARSASLGIHDISQRTPGEHNLNSHETRPSSNPDIANLRSKYAISGLDTVSNRYSGKYNGIPRLNVPLVNGRQPLRFPGCASVAWSVYMAR